MVKVNKAVWENDIREKIVEWKEYSESVFCETEEDKEFTRGIIEKLCQMLETLLTENGITEEQFEWFLSLS